MTGYCEACRREVSGEPDEYDVAVCVDCGCDLIVEVHIERDDYIVSDQELQDLFLNHD